MLCGYLEAEGLGAHPQSTIATALHTLHILWLGPSMHDGHLKVRVKGLRPRKSADAVSESWNMTVLHSPQNWARSNKESRGSTAVHVLPQACTMTCYLLLGSRFQLF